MKRTNVKHMHSQALGYKHSGFESIFEPFLCSAKVDPDYCLLSGRPHV